MISKFSLFTRLIIANALYAIPVIALTYLMMKAQNVNIDFGHQEIKGNQILRPTLDLFESVNFLRFERANTSKYIQKLNESFSLYQEDLTTVGSVL